MTAEDRWGLRTLEELEAIQAAERAGTYQYRDPSTLGNLIGMMADPFSRGAMSGLSSIGGAAIEGVSLGGSFMDAGIKGKMLIGGGTAFWGGSQSDRVGLDDPFSITGSMWSLGKLGVKVGGVGAGLYGVGAGLTALGGAATTTLGGGLASSIVGGGLSLGGGALTTIGGGLVSGVGSVAGTVFSAAGAKIIGVAVAGAAVGYGGQKLLRWEDAVERAWEDAQSGRATYGAGSNFLRAGYWTLGMDMAKQRELDRKIGGDREKFLAGDRSVKDALKAGDWKAALAGTAMLLDERTYKNPHNPVSMRVKVLNAYAMGTENNLSPELKAFAAKDKLIQLGIKAHKRKTDPTDSGRKATGAPPRPKRPARAEATGESAAGPAVGTASEPPPTQDLTVRPPGLAGARADVEAAPPRRSVGQPAVPQGRINQPSVRDQRSTSAGIAQPADVGRTAESPAAQAFEGRKDLGPAQLDPITGQMVRPINVSPALERQQQQMKDIWSELDPERPRRAGTPEPQVQPTAKAREARTPPDTGPSRQNMLESQRPMDRETQLYSNQFSQRPVSARPIGGPSEREAAALPVKSDLSVPILGDEEKAGVTNTDSLLESRPAPTEDPTLKRLLTRSDSFISNEARDALRSHYGLDSENRPMGRASPEVRAQFKKYQGEFRQAMEQARPATDVAESEIGAPARPRKVSAAPRVDTEAPTSEAATITKDTQALAARTYNAPPVEQRPAAQMDGKPLGTVLTGTADLLIDGYPVGELVLNLRG